MCEVCELEVCKLEVLALEVCILEVLHSTPRLRSCVKLCEVKLYEVCEVCELEVCQLEVCALEVCFTAHTRFESLCYESL